MLVNMYSTVFNQHKHPPCWFYNLNTILKQYTCTVYYPGSNNHNVQYLEKKRSLGQSRLNLSGS